ncbi:MAG TPA: preprotein translocase subunit SecE, partial [Firmicutes bacterium]|nr:preprotein translocase subunit SecE [Bacillota bacterium]
MNKIIQWFKDIPGYFKIIIAESKRVSWPGKKEVWGSTIVVIILIIIFAVIIGLFDV